MTRLLLSALLLTILSARGFAEELSASTADMTAAAGKYPLAVCPISGEELGEMGDPVTNVYGGREVTFCCKNCVGTFEKDLAASMKALDKQIIETLSVTYPTDVCLGCGDPISAMGKPYAHLYKNQLIMLCCKECVASFEGNTAVALGALEEARRMAKEPAHE
ncbi:MAG: hypothetical protein IPG71_13775 [bacterium]|nr:hypothetical protein [bacterium]